MRLVADGHDGRLGVGDAARVKLLPADTVDDVLLRVLDARLGDGADDVGLVVLPRLVADIDINDVIGVVQPEHRVGLVPVDVVQLLGLDSASRGSDEDRDNQAQTDLVHFECFCELSLFRQKLIFLNSSDALECEEGENPCFHFGQRTLTDQIFFRAGIRRLRHNPR